MNLFRCACDNRIYFENDHCLRCDRKLGFVPEALTMAALEGQGDVREAVGPEGSLGKYKLCRNYAGHQVCNWLLPADSGEQFCMACRLNRIIPNLAKPGNREKWLNVEREKRRLIYDLLRLGLPFNAKRDNPGTGLAFAFMEDQSPAKGEFVDTAWAGGKVFTGHANGLITINIMEADDAAREAMRQRMNEASRTLLGHFRHEIGHYYWDRLIQDSDWLPGYRALFGDERENYSSALKRHYKKGPPVDWQQHYISAYATAHPWEDWAECWGHYLQITDALETAHGLDMGVRRPVDFDELVETWIQLSICLNLMNRSMGLRDAYPFVLSNPVIEKLAFIHRVIQASATA